jgi:hypothetical protein
MNLPHQDYEVQTPNAFVLDRDPNSEGLQPSTCQQTRPEPTFRDSKSAHRSPTAFGRQ